MIRKCKQIEEILTLPCQTDSDRSLALDCVFVNCVELCVPKPRYDKHVLRVMISVWSTALTMFWKDMKDI